MIQYARPSVDNLINNLPDVLKSARQFLLWNLGAEDKKVPLRADGSRWGSHMDPKCWMNFDKAIDFIDRGKAFGLGLVLPSQQQADSLPDFNLIAGLVAVDADAKHSSVATPYNVPEQISAYVRRLQSYTEFSTSLKGLRALTFGSIPTTKQNVSKSLGNGTELSLYRAGWLTMSGLAWGDSEPRIAYRQDALDHILAELWPNLKVGVADDSYKRLGQVVPPAYEESFVLDWTRISSEDRIRQFIQGYNRTPRQSELITATWELKRGWNHGDTPDCSLYTKRIVEEALWLRNILGWSLQDAVDIVVTFCKKNQLRWSLGRAKKQISDGQHYILTHTRQPRIRVPTDPVVAFASQSPQHPPTLTCNVAKIIREQKGTEEASLGSTLVNDLGIVVPSTQPDSLSLSSALKETPKLSGDFRYKSGPRDAVLKAIDKHAGWVKIKTIAAECGKSAEAVRKQLKRLKKVGLVDFDGKGRYRKRRDRKLRKLKPCSSRPVAMCRGINKERKRLTRSELSKRGWPKELIDKSFPRAGKDYIERKFPCPWSGRIVNTRLYQVSLIKEVELQPWFEVERAKILRRTTDPTNRSNDD